MDGESISRPNLFAISTMCEVSCCCRGLSAPSEEKHNPDTRVGVVAIPHSVTYGNGGPALARKNFIGELRSLFVQPNGSAGELVVKTALQSVRFVDDWI
jgi:hypothetical protein